MNNEAYFWLKTVSMSLGFILILTFMLLIADAVETKQMLDHGFVRGAIAGSNGIRWMKPGECK